MILLFLTVITIRVSVRYYFVELDYKVLSFYTLVTKTVVSRWLKNPIGFVPPNSTITGFFVLVDRRLKDDVASWTD